MPNSYLPPVGVILVDDLQQVSGGKAEPGLLAGNEAIRGWVLEALQGYYIVLGTLHNFGEVARCWGNCIMLGTSPSTGGDESCRGH